MDPPSGACTDNPAGGLPQSPIPQDAFIDKFQRIEQGVDAGFQQVLAQLKTISDQIAVASSPPGVPNLPPRDPQVQQLDGRTLPEEHATLQSQYDELARRSNEQIQELLTAQTELKKELGALRKTELTLRSIVFGNAGHQDATDNEITRKFTGLRQLIQSLSRNPAFEMDQNFMLPPDATDIMKGFYKYISVLSPNDIALRIRGMMFEIIHEEILSSAVFGLDDHNHASRQHKIENRLADFEFHLRERRVPSPAIDDWVISTLRTIEQLGVQEQTSRHVAGYMRRFFDPVVKRRISPEAKAGLAREMEKLCAEAFQLRVRMRLSKEGYRCGTLEPRSLISENQLYGDAFAVEGGKSSERSDEICYTLFGYLEKHPMYRDEGKKVLEQAQVILRKRK